MIKVADLLPRARDPHTVVVAELPDGRQFKVTGYERAAIWARRPELAPLQVNVIGVPVAGAEGSWPPPRTSGVHADDPRRRLQDAGETRVISAGSRRQPVACWAEKSRPRFGADAGCGQAPC